MENDDECGRLAIGYQSLTHVVRVYLSTRERWPFDKYPCAAIAFVQDRERHARGSSLANALPCSPNATDWYDERVRDYNAAWVTDDGNYWICPACFKDFRERLQRVNQSENK